MYEFVELIWDYKPPDYFYEPLLLNYDKYDIEIDGGKAKAKMKSQVFIGNTSITEEIFDIIVTHFISAQLIDRKTYILKNEHVIIKTGKVGTSITPLPADTITFAESGNVIKKDKNGKTLFDMRKDQQEKGKKITEMALRHKGTNPTIRLILDSFNNSISHEDNELVYLYEIFETIRKALGGEDKLSKILDISKSKLKHFRQLANATPVKSSRHRGKQSGELRDATQIEIENARNVAKELILKYLNYLDHTSAFSGPQSE